MGSASAQTMMELRSRRAKRGQIKVTKSYQEQSIHRDRSHARRRKEKQSMAEVEKTRRA
uniref:Uncharacterized protein n=1 Tax=Arundo donax TaxID=35708 RepID=A0A0A8XXQ9_ARUDO